MGWTLWVQLPIGAMLGIFLSPPRPYRLWCPYSLIPSGYRRLFTPVVKRLKHKTEHSLPYSADVKNVWSFTTAPQYVFMSWCLIKQQIHLHDMVLSKDQGQLHR